MKATRGLVPSSGPVIAAVAGVRPALAALPGGGGWAGIAASAAAHLALAGWAASVGLFSHDEVAAAPERAEVTLISAAEFSALRSQAPQVPSMSPSLAAPDATDFPTPSTAQAMAPFAAEAIAPSLAAASGSDVAPIVETAPSPPPPKASPKEVPERPIEKVAAPKPAAAPANPSVQASAATVAAKPAVKAATVGKAQKSLIADWGGKIRSRINRAKSYPKAAQAEGATGTVTLRITVLTSGRVSAVAVAKSSGHAALDSAALAAVKKAGKLPPAPRGLEGDSFAFSLPVSFSR